MTVTEAPTLLERRIKAEAALLTLEREQGAALLDGKPFDAAVIAEIKAELSAIEHAERATNRRDSAANAEQGAAQRRQAAQDARGALSAYSDAVTRGEAATKALAGELAAIDQAAATLRKAFLVMQRRLPIPLEAHAMRTTLSRLMIGELNKVAEPNRLGDIKWPSVPRNQVWLDHVERYIKPAVETAIQENLL